MRRAEARMRDDDEVRDAGEGLDRAAREQLLQVGADHAGQQHEGLLARREFVGQQVDRRARAGIEEQVDRHLRHRQPPVE